MSLWSVDISSQLGKMAIEWMDLPALKPNEVLIQDASGVHMWFRASIIIVRVYSVRPEYEAE